MLSRTFAENISTYYKRVQRKRFAVLLIFIFSFCLILHFFGIIIEYICLLRGIHVSVNLKMNACN